MTLLFLWENASYNNYWTMESRSSNLHLWSRLQLYTLSFPMYVRSPNISPMSPISRKKRWSILITCCMASPFPKKKDTCQSCDVPQSSTMLFDHMSSPKNGSFPMKRDDKASSTFCECSCELQSRNTCSIVYFVTNQKTIF